VRLRDPEGIHLLRSRYSSRKRTFVFFLILRIKIIYQPVRLRDLGIGWVSKSLLPSSFPRGVATMGGQGATLFSFFLIVSVSLFVLFLKRVRLRDLLS
jgi:hypothetical protein